MNQDVENIWELYLNREKNYKAINKKRLGWSSIYTPEEIIHAFRVIPYRIDGEQYSDTTNASAYLNRNICSFVLSSLEEGFCHDDPNVLGIVMVDTCSSRRKQYDIWKHYLQNQYSYCISFPPYCGDLHRDFYRESVKDFIQSFKNFIGEDLLHDNLINSINIFNESRSLMAKLYSLRKLDNPQITGLDALKIVRAGMTGLREEFNHRLKILLNKLELTNNQEHKGKHRVLLCGAYFNDEKILQSIESDDVVVVAEDNSNGMKYFEGLVKLENDPIDDLCRHYFDKATSSCIADLDKRVVYLEKLIDEYKVDSVVYFSLKFCDTNLVDYPYIREKLKKKGVSVLFVESERHSTNIESIKTRIKSFFETKVYC